MNLDRQTELEAISEEGQQQELVISEDYAGWRADKYLTCQFDEYTRSFLQKLVDQKNLTINGKTVTKSGYKLQQGDTLLLRIPEPEPLVIEAEDIPLDILYEDQDVILVNKPKGMVVHPAAGHTSGTLVNALMYHCKDSLSGINGVMRPGIVHRIDMDTTGVLIACKNDAAHNSIAAQLKEHSITRRYYAIVHGGFSQDEGVIDAPIGRHPNDRKRMAINQKNGKHAVTHYRVLQRFSRHTLIECRLETGRTHQIRVHMSSIGHPLLGDTVYGSSRQEFHLRGQTLHAYILGFIHPTTGIYTEVTAPLPAYFANLLKNL
ncbi:MAG: RluA family pseudouridine synthase [Lachnospiraceae bacterium]|nr:RluA family pseudouridine synthase [Lachnospiraceae bacterium]